MPTKRPTVTELQQQINSMQANLVDHNTRIFNLETAKIATDAIADYLIKHPVQTQADNKINKELLKYIGIAFTIIASLVTAMVAKP